MKRVPLGLLFFFLLEIILPRAGFSQPATVMNDDRDIGRPTFTLDAINLLSDDPGKTLLVVYIEILFDNLQFIRAGDRFEARYEADISVLAGKDENAPRVANALKRSTVTLDDYEQTNARDRYDVAVSRLEVPAGTYTLMVTVTDLESRLKSENKLTVKVPSYEVSGLHLGDLLIAKKIRIAKDGFYEIVPNVSRRITNIRRPLYVYYEVYPARADTLDVYSRILNERGDVVRELSFRLESVRPVTRNFVAYSINSLPYGSYEVELQVSSGEQRALKSTDFQIQVAGLQGMVSNLDDAIRQLRYIASTREIKQMLSANPVKREQLFRAFWKKFDPSPETPTNELMEEYYSRINRANEMFGTFRQGWETDRGEIYVRFGPPSEIERHPFDINSKPYEIWYYYDLKLQYIFVDENGYGEYRRVNALWQ